MARELRVGDRVRTPRGVGVIAAWSEYRDAYRVTMDGVESHWWDECDVHAIPSDIPRERVEDLHAAVVKRVEQLWLAMEGYRKEPFAQGFDIASACKNELATFAEALRLLLEVPDAD